MYYDNEHIADAIRKEPSILLHGTATYNADPFTITNDLTCEEVARDLVGDEDTRHICEVVTRDSVDADEWSLLLHRLGITGALRILRCQPCVEVVLLDDRTEDLYIIECTSPTGANKELQLVPYDGGALSSEQEARELYDREVAYIRSRPDLYGTEDNAWGVDYDLSDTDCEKRLRYLTLSRITKPLTDDDGTSPDTDYDYIEQFTYYDING